MRFGWEVLRKTGPWCNAFQNSLYILLLMVSRARCLFHSSDVSQMRDADIKLFFFSRIKSSLGSCLHEQHDGHSFLWDVEIVTVQHRSQYSWIWFCLQHSAFHSKGAGLVISQRKGPRVGQCRVFCPHWWKVCTTLEGSGNFRDKADPQKEVWVLKWKRRKSLVSWVILAFQWLLVLKVFTRFKDTSH